eukprot:5795813-Pyramimonas_sp.AAC.1
MPRDVENYVHRIGRTGRTLQDPLGPRFCCDTDASKCYANTPGAGAKGAAITFWNETYDTMCAPALAKVSRQKYAVRSSMPFAQ